RTAPGPRLGEPPVARVELSVARFCCHGSRAMACAGAVRCHPRVRAFADDDWDSGAPAARLEARPTRFLGPGSLAREPFGHRRREKLDAAGLGRLPGQVDLSRLRPRARAIRSV